MKNPETSFSTLLLLQKKKSHIYTEGTDLHRTKVPKGSEGRVHRVDPRPATTLVTQDLCGLSAGQPEPGPASPMRLTGVPGGAATARRCPSKPSKC